MATHNPADFPPPAIPISPVLSSKSIHLKKDQPSERLPSILDLQYQLNVTSGRAAIALALEDCGVAEGDEVLMPAYHCESMVAPARWRKAKPVFYQIDADARIDLADITARITPDTKALLVTHYFGFLQDLTELRSLCDQHNIVMIEDCAHTFFGVKDGHNIGTTGDYAIASSMKFFPVYDGGVLASAMHSLENIPVQRPPLRIQLKSLINIVEKSIGYRRLGLPGRILNAVTRLKDLVWNLTKSTGFVESNAPASSEGGYQLDEHWIHVRASSMSSQIIVHSDMRDMAQKRRSNYLKLHQALADLPGSHPLHTSLPDDMVPLVYPLFIDEPDKHFAHLKFLGIPIWRFGERLDADIDRALYKNSAQLSDHIFQLPCHQELKPKEMDWMIAEVKRSLTR